MPNLADDKIRLLRGMHAGASVRLAMGRFDAALARCESPIEKLLLAGILSIDGVESVECSAGGEVARLAGGMVLIQRVVGRYRLDIAIEGGSVLLAVECDGHEFHERTRQQAEHDKARERSLVESGWRVLRFSGSEIWRDPEACARQVIATWGRLRGVCSPGPSKAMARSHRLTAAEEVITVGLLRFPALWSVAAREGVVGHFAHPGLKSLVARVVDLGTAGQPVADGRALLDEVEDDELRRRLAGRLQEEAGSLEEAAAHFEIVLAKFRQELRKQKAREILAAADPPVVEQHERLLEESRDLHRRRRGV